MTTERDRAVFSAMFSFPRSKARPIAPARREIKAALSQRQREREREMDLSSARARPRNSNELFQEKVELAGSSSRMEPLLQDLSAAVSIREPRAPSNLNNGPPTTAFRRG